jgi:NAD(P)-dependent dehydrogenase (short-subunit alcohol dehydrogenase family)
MRLEGKVTIITGGASGMGRVAADLFAKEGARLVLADVSEEAVESAAADIRAAGGDATAVVADVSNEEHAKRMVDHAVATYGRVDALYNNAGIMPAADHSVTDTDVATWDKVMAVNVRGVFLGCKYAIPRMVDQKAGSIIFETPLLLDWLVKDEEAKRIRLARNPTGRFGKPEEIVYMAMYLASDESRWTNGASLVVDGGITVNYC